MWRRCHVTLKAICWTPMVEWHLHHSAFACYHNICNCKGCTFRTGFGDVGGGKTDGISGFVSSLLFMCGLGQSNQCSDLLRPGDLEDRILVRARYSHPIKTGHRTHPASYTRVPDHYKECSNRDVELTAHLYVVPRMKEGWKYTSASRLRLYCHTLYIFSTCVDISELDEV